MNAFMDNLWLKIEAAVQVLRGLLDAAFGPLHVLGPAAVIFVIALVTVLVTKVLSKTIRTRRHGELKKEFVYWHDLRQVAMKAEDVEKGRMLARNIDQAKLNRAYYDYFFENLMLNLATKYLPILVFMAYVNETYRPAAMEALYGREELFFIPWSGAPVPVGPVFWFVLSLVMIFIAWPLSARLLRRILRQLDVGKLSGSGRVASENGS